MFLLFRRTTDVQVRFQPAGEVAVRSAVVVAIVTAAARRADRAAGTRADS